MKQRAMMLLMVWLQHITCNPYHHTSNVDLYAIIKTIEKLERA